MSPSSDFPPNPLEKDGYRLEINDEFDSERLNADIWLPFYLPHWSSRAQTAPNYVIENSCLILQITKEQVSWCPEFDGEVRCSSIQTGQFSGAPGSKIGQLQFSEACVVREEQQNVQLYTPQYGYFEIRAKGLNTSANHAAFWMIGYEDTPERSGEICVCELVGAQSSPTSSSVRYGLHPWADQTLSDSFYEDYFPLDTAKFHIYAVEWTPAYVDFYLDNLKIKTIHQSPQYPMQFMLSLYEHRFSGAWTGEYNPADPYPKQFAMDYFRAYQSLNGYSSY